MFSAPCGGILTSATGRIATENYPSPYPINSRCYWTIETEPETRISLDFNDVSFQVEGGISCPSDRVRVFDTDGLDLGMWVEFEYLYWFDSFIGNTSPPMKPFLSLVLYTSVD